MQILDPAHTQIISASSPSTHGQLHAGNCVCTVTAAPPAPVLPLNSSARSRAATMDELNRLNSCARGSMTSAAAFMLSYAPLLAVRELNVFQSGELIPLT